LKIYNDEKKKIVVDVFLLMLGEKIKSKRTKKGIKQENLAAFLGLSKSSVSQYENGTVDFPVSKLPLISNYCDFPITEYFDKEMVQVLTFTFEEIAIIIREKMERKKKRNGKGNSENHKSKRILKGYIYEIDGQDETVPVTKKNENTLKQMYLRGEMPVNQKPFDTNGLAEFLQVHEQSISALDAARRFLAYIGDAPQKETMKGNIAEFVIGEILISPIIKSQSVDYEQLYALYKSILDGNSMEDNNKYLENESKDRTNDKPLE